MRRRRQSHREKTLHRDVALDAVEWQIGRHYIVVTHIDTCLVGIGQEISVQEGRIMGQAPSSSTQCAEWEKGSTLIESPYLDKP